MSSFVRKNPRLSSVLKADATSPAFPKQSSPNSSTLLPGLSPSLSGSSTLLASSGIPSLDVVLGGGLPVSSLLTVFEDFPASKANYTWTAIVRCFLAEGLASCQAELTRKDTGWLGIISHDIPNFFDTLPKPERLESKESDIPSTTESNSEMKIAWRYEGLKEFDSSLKKSDSSLQGDRVPFGHTFDLGRKQTVTGTVLLERMVLFDLKDQQLGSSTPCTYKRTLEVFSQAIRDHQRFGLGRFVIGSLGAPGYWNCDGCKNECGPAWLVRAISNLLQELESSHPCIVLVTIPVTYLLSGQNLLDSLDNANTSPGPKILPAWISAAENVSDAVIELVPLAAVEKKMTKSKDPLNEYDGFLMLRKPLRRPNSFRSSLPETQNLIFKIKRRRFLIEKFHLPPALEESSSTACSSTSSNASKSLLDF